MRLYNTLTRQQEEFAPVRDHTVRMYTCGLTVYSRGHIGNFRTFVCVDVLRRSLKYVGRWQMHHVMNFTDVDDKTILGAQREGLPLREYTDRYIAAFREDASALGIEPVEETPRATDPENLQAMVDMIRQLGENGHTYRSDGSIYFKISSLPDYGKLARLDHAGIQAGARVDADEYEKEDARDFVLWKATQPDRADLGPGLRSGPPRLAHRVLGDGASSAAGVAHRHPHRRRRSRLPASRERDRAERGRDWRAVLALLGPRRAPARRRPEDVEVGRQRLQRRGRSQPRVPAVGAAISAAVGALPQAAQLHVDGPGAGRRNAAAADRLSRAGRFADARAARIPK